MENKLSVQTSTSFDLKLSKDDVFLVLQNEKIKTIEDQIQKLTNDNEKLEEKIEILKKEINIEFQNINKLNDFNNINILKNDSFYHEC